MSRTRSCFLLASLLLAGCSDGDNEDRACAGGVGQISAKVPDVNPSKPLERDLDVSGTISRPAGVTVYNVWVRESPQLEAA